MRAHRFFVEETPGFVGRLVGEDTYGYPVYKLSLKSKIYYPIAYARFMVSVIKDCIKKYYK